MKVKGLEFFGGSGGAAGASISNIQRGTATGVAASHVEAISAVTLANSIMLFTYRNDNASGGTPTPDEQPRGWISSSTQLTFDRNSAGAGTLEIEWTVIEFNSAVTVEHIAATASLASPAATVDVTITSVDTAKSFLLFNYNIDDTIGAQQMLFEATFTSATNVRLERDHIGAGTDTLDYALQIVTFP